MPPQWCLNAIALFTFGLHQYGQLVCRCATILLFSEKRRFQSVPSNFKRDCGRPKIPSFPTSKTTLRALQILAAPCAESLSVCLHSWLQVPGLVSQRSWVRPRAGGTNIAGLPRSALRASRRDCAVGAQQGLQGDPPAAWAGTLARTSTRGRRRRRGGKAEEREAEAAAAAADHFRLRPATNA